MNARGTSLEFQSSYTSLLSEVERICSQDVAGIISSARDFRKICPPQVAGLGGGYSEAEIADIDRLLEGQCSQIAALNNEWLAAAQRLQQQQQQLLQQVQEAFMDEFRSTSRDLAMAEGLGQKFGGPRRVAQEKIHSELSRDDRRAGRIDELLALLEFMVAELQRGEALVTNNSNSSTGAPPPLYLNTACHMWELLQQIRGGVALQASYLQVLADPPPPRPPPSPGCRKRRWHRWGGGQGGPC